MVSWNKNNTIFIQASTGFLYEGCKSEGYLVYHPYIGNSLFFRLLREIFFRISFLPSEIWYERAFLKNKRIKHIILWDPLITADYINWLQTKFPKAQVYFQYYNMVGKARHLMPNEIPPNIELWTFDDYDSQKYSINLLKNYTYFSKFVKPLQKPVYDIFFIGCDKGRGEFLLGLEREMNSLGLKTKFIITADGKLSSKKSYYQKPITYSEVIEYLRKSRAVLNVGMKNQKGITLRDIESAFFGIKLVTTNENIVNADFYNTNNVFILGKQQISELPKFIRSSTEEIDQQILKRHTISGMVDEIIGNQ